MVQVTKNGHERQPFLRYVGTVTASQLTKTDWHYDRGGQGYPEGYDTSKATDKNKTKYDRDGAKVGVVTIGGTQPVNVVIKFHGINMKQMLLPPHEVPETNKELLVNFDKESI